MPAPLHLERSSIVIERLPAYAPEPSAVEARWGSLTGTELANPCVDTLAETEYYARCGIKRVRRGKDLTFAFRRPTGLSGARTVTVLRETQWDMTT